MSVLCFSGSVNLLGGCSPQMSDVLSMTEDLHVSVVSVFVFCVVLYVVWCVVCVYVGCVSCCVLCVVLCCVVLCVVVCCLLCVFSVFVSWCLGMLRLALVPGISLLTSLFSFTFATPIYPDPAVSCVVSRRNKKDLSADTTKNEGRDEVHDRALVHQGHVSVSFLTLLRLPLSLCQTAVPCIFIDAWTF